jgi:hypothetical protein
LATSTESNTSQAYWRPRAKGADVDWTEERLPREPKAADADWTDERRRSEERRRRLKRQPEASGK